MKFTIERAMLMHEVSIAQEAITNRNTLSILATVLFKAEPDNTLLIRSTDNRMSVESRMMADIVTPGATAILCDKLLEILRACPDGVMEFTLSEELLIVRPADKRVEFRIRTMSPDTFPELKLAPEDSYFDIPQAGFLEMINQTIFSISTDETRYFLNGVYFERDEDQLVMVSTDGRRLSLIAKRMESGASHFEGVIVPPKILNLVKKLCSGEGGISVSITEKQIFFKLVDHWISSTLIEGQFPNYKRVIPEHQEHSAEVKREELLQALRRVSLFVEQSKRMFLHLSNNEMRLYSKERETGEVTEQLSCSYTGPEIEFALNYQFLLDPARAMESELVRIDFTTSMKAISISPSPEADYFHIAMPMQLD